MKNIIMGKKARIRLQKMPRNESKRIISKVKEYVSDPIGFQHMSTKIVGADMEYRLRVGDWRILYQIDGDDFYISDILPRGNAYI